MKLDLPNKSVKNSDDDRAVSPVVGVALLIAITVILAAVIGFVVLDTTVSNTDNPNVRLTFEGVDPTVVSHEGGDELTPEQVVVKVIEPDGDTRKTTLEGDVGGTFNTGDRFEVSTNPNETVIIFWEDPQSGREVQLAKTTVK